MELIKGELYSITNLNKRKVIGYLDRKEKNDFSYLSLNKNETILGVFLRVEYIEKICSSNWNINLHLFLHKNKIIYIHKNLVEIKKLEKFT